MLLCETCMSKPVSADPNISQCNACEAVDGHYLRGAQLDDQAVELALEVIRQLIHVTDGLRAEHLATGLRIALGLVMFHA